MNIEEEEGGTGERSGEKQIKWTSRKGEKMRELLEVSPFNYVIAGELSKGVITYLIKHS